MKAMLIEKKIKIFRDWGLFQVTFMMSIINQSDEDSKLRYFETYEK